MKLKLFSRVIALIPLALIALAVGLHAQSTSVTYPILALPAYTDAAGNSYATAVAEIVGVNFCPVQPFGANVTWYVYTSKAALQSNLAGTTTFADIGEFHAALPSASIPGAYSALIAGAIPLGPTILGTAQGIPALAGGVADSVTFTPPAPGN